jgi:phosphate transport system ATP-binding protein
VPEVRLPKVGVVAVMGPSGSGKSTLAQGVSELMDENLSRDGLVHINCGDGNEVRRGRRSYCAMVWQKPTVFPCSIWDNLKIPLRKRKAERKEWLGLMEDALQKTGLLGELDEQWWRQQANRLSGGSSSACPSPWAC